MSKQSRVRIRFTPDGEVDEYWLAGCEGTLEADRRGWHCMMLAPTIDICQALIRGERVPRALLRQDQLSRFASRS